MTPRLEGKIAVAIFLDVSALLIGILCFKQHKKVEKQKQEYMNTILSLWDDDKSEEEKEQKEMSNKNSYKICRDGEQITCAFKICKKPLTTDMEIEYSAHATELFCCPDCATSFYYDYMESKPLNEEFDFNQLGYTLERQQ